MKAIIHIGMLKTGSTSIQAWLQLNRVKLESAGVHHFWGNQRRKLQLSLKYTVYQLTLRELGVDEKYGMGRAANPRFTKHMDEICRIQTGQLEKFSREPGVFILSIEHIYGFRESQMIAIDNYFSRFFDDLTYVVYIRNTVDFFVSLYWQKLFQNFRFDYGTQHFSCFMNKCASNIIPYQLESSFDNLFAWSNILGDKLNVRLLEPEWLHKGDLVEDFAYLVGVPTIGTPGRKNESIAAEYIEYVRYLNHEYYRKNISRATRKRTINILMSASSGKPRLAASDAQAKSIQNIHHDQQEKIRKRFFPDRPCLFSSKIRGNGISPRPLTERKKAEIESEISQIMARGLGDT